MNYKLGSSESKQYHILCFLINFFLYFINIILFPERLWSQRN